MNPLFAIILELLKLAHACSSLLMVPSMTCYLLEVMHANTCMHAIIMVMSHYYTFHTDACMHEMLMTRLNEEVVIVGLALRGIQGCLCI